MQSDTTRRQANKMYLRNSNLLQKCKPPTTSIHIHFELPAVVALASVALMHSNKKTMNEHIFFHMKLNMVINLIIIYANELSISHQERAI